jgi:hypothetical protein
MIEFGMHFFVKIVAKSVKFQMGLILLNLEL